MFLAASLVVAICLGLLLAFLGSRSDALNEKAYGILGRVLGGVVFLFVLATFVWMFGKPWPY